jgi:Ser/Thr protein kinase RdoA (MazF antagonist)
MSDPDVYRAPAWIGVRARRAAFVDAPDALASRVLAAIGCRGRVSMLANANPEAPRALRVECAGGERLFVKTIAASRVDEIAAAEGIAGWLARQGVPAVAAREILPLPAGDALAVYPFLDADPPSSDERACAALGAAIAALHQTLDRHPDRERWVAETESRLGRLSVTRDALAQGTLAAGPDPRRTAAFVRNARASFAASFDDMPSRALHGDLNAFNILIAGDAVSFLDFEDVHHSVLPPLFEIALVCERVILAAEPDNARAQRCVAALLDAYASNGGWPIGATQRMPDALEALAVRSICTLAQIDRAGADAAEWTKFFELAAQARARAGAFA